MMRKSNERGFECSEDVPFINLDGMCNPMRKPILVELIANDCLRFGFFQVINHGISQQILDGALYVTSDFFNLSTRDKAKFLSPDIHRPVRYITSFKDVCAANQAQSWRAFLKRYAHPLQDWIGLDCGLKIHLSTCTILYISSSQTKHLLLTSDMIVDNTDHSREKIGEYVVEIQKLALKIIDVFSESLGLGPTYLTSKLDQGMQVITINCYPSCPQPQLSLGIPPHSDYSCLTILLQDSLSLQILDSVDGSWRVVSVIHTTLQVNVDDHLEVLSNGMYKSVVHRVTVRGKGTRISIASLHSLGMDVKMEVARELVDEENPESYRRSSFRDFLNFASKNELGEGASFLDSLKINPKSGPSLLYYSRK